MPLQWFKRTSKSLLEKEHEKKRKLFGCLLRLFIGGQVEKEKMGSQEK
ncbi:hypothetical protein ABER23_08755 [Paenibacillus lautus]